MITVIDNLFEEKYQNDIENLIINSELPLFYNKSTIADEERHKLEKNVLDLPQFTHSFLRDEQINSGFWPIFLPIAQILNAKIEKLQTLNLTRFKLNLNFLVANAKSNQYFPQHIDMGNKEGITIIYYVNNSDGDTLFFDQNKKIIKRNTPKKGSIVMFDNQLIHAGQPPVKSPFRSVININWIKK
jgi:hypothetical protein